MKRNSTTARNKGKLMEEVRGGERDERPHTINRQKLHSESRHPSRKQKKTFNKFLILESMKSVK